MIGQNGGMTTTERLTMQARFSPPEEDGWELFARAPAVRFASADAEGRPVLRTLSAVVLEGRLCFHGADDGEKLGLVGRPAVASYDEVVAQVPSYWVHPELACPASTYYLSVQAEGIVTRVDDRARKARILSALMARFQPEGGFLPITADAPRYAKVLDALLVAELVPARVSCKHKLGQHRSLAQIERVLAGLWQRGATGDLAAMRRVREAHPARPVPAFLARTLEACCAPRRTRPTRSRSPAARRAVLDRGLHPRADGRGAARLGGLGGRARCRRPVSASGRASATARASATFST